MAEVINEGDTLEALAYRLLGDSSMGHEIMIPGYPGEGPLPVGQKAYLRDEKLGPPSRRWTDPP